MNFTALSSPDFKKLIFELSFIIEKSTSCSSFSVNIMIFFNLLIIICFLRFRRLLHSVSAILFFLNPTPNTPNPIFIFSLRNSGFVMLILIISGNSIRIIYCQPIHCAKPNSTAVFYFESPNII